MTADCDVAIVGGGFSGAMLAAHLLADKTTRSGHVLLIDRMGRFGRGVAYSTPNQRHLLNVPAGSMSAFDDRPDHFLNWARKRLPEVDRGSYLPRTLYGDYVASVLDDAIRHRRHGSTIELRVAGVRRIELGKHGSPAHLHLDDGDVTARRVVLAMGNAASRKLAVPGMDDPLAAGRYVPDPWAPGALEPLAAMGDILVLGTGLTLIDVALDLAGRGHRGRVFGLSRRGLLPQAHHTAPVPPPGSWIDQDALAGRLTPSALVRVVRSAVARAAAEGVDWRSVLAELRPVTPTLWRRLDVRGQASFLRHAAPYWETHRHRVAPAVEDAVFGLLASGQLEVRAGHLVAAEGHRSFVAARVQPRGAGRKEILHVAAIVNCTGPDPDIRNTSDPAIKSLLAAGAIRPGPNALGVDVDSAGAAVSRDGTYSRTLFTLGPLRRGRLYETTAVPELRTQVVDLAARIGATLSR